MAKVLIEFETNLGSLEAAISKVEQNTDQLSESAAAAGKKVSEEYRKVAASAKAAFASSEVDSAIKAQAANVDKLSENLEVLYKEELRLLKLNKQASDEFKKNQAAIAATRQEFDKLRATQQGNNKETEQANNKAKSLTGQLRALKEQLLQLEQQGKENTKEFLQIAVAAGRLEDKIGDTRERVKSLSSDTFVFDAAIDSLNAVAGGFAVVQGAVGLFAEDNEELQRAIAKTNSALAILNGLQQVQQFLVGKSAGAIALQTAAQTTYNAVVGTSVGLLKVFRIALAATGLGALVFVLFEIYKAYERYNTEVRISNQLLKDAAEVTLALRKDTEALNNELIRSNERLLVSEGKLSQAEKEKRDLRRDAFQEGLKANAEAIITLSKLAAQEEQLTIKVEQQRKVLAERRKQFEALPSKQNESFLQNAQRQLTNVINELGEVQDQREKLNQSISENIVIRKKLLSNEIKTIDIEEVKNRQQINQRELEEKRQLDKKRLDDFKKFLEETRKLEIEFRKNNTIDSALEALNKEREERELEQKRLFNVEVSKLDETSNQERFNRRANFLKAEIAEDDKTLQTRIQLIKTEGEAQKAEIRDRLGFTSDANNQIRIIEAETAERIKEARRQANEELIREITQYVGAVQQSFNAIVDLQRASTEQRIEQIERIRDIELEANNTAEKSFAERKRNEEAINLRASRKITEEKRKQARLDKALGIFNATIDTAKAIVGFLSDPGGVAGIVLSVAAGITGATQIAKISSEPLPSFGRGGWIDGEPHSRGGVDINAEGGEFVTRASEARKNRKELQAMNTSRASFLKLIEENYVKPRLMAATLERDRNGVSVNVNARLNGSGIEQRLDSLRQETRKTGKIMQKLVASSNSSRYNW
jgi:hypothetical protein